VRWKVDRGGAIYENDRSNDDGYNIMALTFIKNPFEKYSTFAGGDRIVL